MYKDRILRLLRSHEGFLSGEELAAKMGISRTMVWKHIRSLEREGFTVEAVRSRGYRLTASPDLLRAGDIRSGLRTKTVGKVVQLLAETESTNTVAMEMASQGAAEGTVVIAEVQTAGRGRLGRKWISPKGNLYLSIIFRPALPVHKAPLMTLMGAVALASAIRSACSLPAVIKWPNDVLVSGRKAGGLLTEMRAEPDHIKHIVLGIGVDVNMDPDALPDSVRAVSTTLASEAGRSIDRTALLQHLLRELDRWYRLFLSSEGAVLKEWKRLNCTLGNRVSVSGAGEAFEGQAREIDAEGRLVVVLDDGSERTVAAGDVSLAGKSPDR
jgi:BirA family biotin operon repressor/biotin-[acetyl-CoA-carboxylase] ligase